MRSTLGEALAAAVPVGVLAVDPGGLAPFGPAKWLVLPAAVLAAVAAVTRRGAVSLARGPALAWGVFLLVGAAAAVFGVDRLYAWTGTPERRFGVLTWLLCALAFAVGQALVEAERKAAVTWAAATCGVIGAWALAESVGWQPLSLVGAGDRPVGPFGSSAYLGAAVALLAPAAAGIALDSGWPTNVRRATGVAGALGAMALVTSGARAAWLGALVALVLLTLARGRQINRLDRRHRRRLAPVAVAGAAAVVVLALATGVAGRVPDVVRDRDGGARGRLDEWRVAVRVVAAHPVLGVGPEGYRIAFGRSVDEAYERDHGRDPLPDRAHSALLDVAATTGLAGLAAYLTLIAVVGRRVLWSLRRGPTWSAGAAVGLIAYAVQSLFLFPIGELEPVAWLLAGAVVATSMRSGEVMETRLPKAVPVVAGFLAGAALVAGGLDVAADRAARRTLTAAARGVAVDPRRAARLRPDVLRYHLVAARAFEDDPVEGTDRAVAELDRALSVSPRDPIVRGERARLLLARARQTGAPGDLGAARRALAALAIDDPRNAEVLLRLGVAEALSGDDAGAERAWRKAEHLAPDSAAASTDLALAYVRAGRLAEARAAARRALAREPANERARAVLREIDGT